jgi:hypothetical protein
MPKTASKTPVLRRSFALPQSLVKQAQAYLPVDQRSNLNGLMKQALEDFVRQHRYEDFRRSVEKMAQNPKTLAEHRRMLQDYAGTDEDGLK